MKNFNEIDFYDQDVILRVDFNVPILNGKIINDYRLRKALPTMKHILQQGGRLRIIAHLGRPHPGTYKEELSLKQLLPILQEMLEGEITFSTELEPKNVKIVLYENIRFQIGEKENNSNLAKKIASLGTIFVLDAFGTAHRSHASIVGVIDFVKVASIGLLFQEEIKHLSGILNTKKEKSLAIIGGSKIDTKVNILKKLASKFETIIVAGKMANTLLYLRGVNIGNSMIEHDMLDLAKEILNSSANIILPIDGVDQYGKAKMLHTFVDTDVICDIAKNSVKLFEQYINKAELILWNGPMGIFEQEEFANGTKKITQVVANANAITVIGGGETVSAIERFSDKEQFTYVSTGGGAFLEYLEKGSIVALDVLSRI